MGAMQLLGLEVRPANMVQRGMQRVASTRPAAWVFAKIMHPVDKLLYRMTGGRLTVPGLVAGLPVVMLTTTGARSGQRRTMPLVAIPAGGDLAVIGSNYGQASTPGWVYNLEADPSAEITYRDRSVPVTARRADPTETDHAFERAAEVYPGYAKYRVRADHRDIRVFVLEPSVPSGSSAGTYSADG
jgi:deazaflavin-dependent oxidoreductase (nitroreductase family)